MITTLTIVHMVVSVLLIITVLLQFGRGAEAGFFSDASSNSVFAGPQQGNLLAKVTTVLAILFLGLALLLANLRGQQQSSSTLDNIDVPVTTPLSQQPLNQATQQEQKAPAKVETKKNSK